jgi:phosphatidylethanolamine/phosphatidyl-N-methylethanolamine N-methyltransferase
MTVEEIEKVYNRYSKHYDFLFGKVFQNGRERGPALLDLFAGAKLLEVGIGTGLSLPLLNRGVQITGIDLSEKMLEQARKRVDALKLDNVRLMKMDATRLEFEDGSFDRVYAAYFISTVPDALEVVREMKRVCRPGGYLVFLNHFLSENLLVACVEKAISPLCYRLGFRTDLDLRTLIRDAGLEIDIIEPIDFLGHWKAVRCINPSSTGRALERESAETTAVAPSVAARNGSGSRASL